MMGKSRENSIISKYCHNWRGICLELKKASVSADTDAERHQDWRQPVLLIGKAKGQTQPHAGGRRQESEIKEKSGNTKKLRPGSVVVTDQGNDFAEN